MSHLSVEHRPFSVAPDDWAHVDFTRRLRAQLVNLRGGMVCELGGGARPAIESEFVQSYELDYLVVDISEPELRKAPDGYATLVGDVSSPEFAAGEHAGRYDLVFSRVLAEHVRDARRFHQNVHRLLRPGGIAMHFFPTFWWPPFVVNRLLPESIAEPILLRIEPWREKSGRAGKFPAYYRWCRGPTAGQVRRLRSAGFAVDHCVAYFGESTHAPGRLLQQCNAAWTALMMRHPNYHLTSYATYVLRAE
jgi:SAM-dependent methyltransferase